MGDIYCKKCLLKSDHPGIKLDDNGVCSLCRGHNEKDMSTNYNNILNDYMEYNSVPPRRDGNYDCVLMLSGGKDSINMLKKVVAEHGKKPLAYTYIHPFESKNAEKNIKRVLNAMDIDHVYYTSYKKYKRFMNRVFTCQTIEDKYQVEKLPCIACSYYMMLSACIFALRMNIPYVMYCADPNQMLGSDSNIKKIVKYLEAAVGNEVLLESFGEPLNELLDNSKARPKIIFPYVSMFRKYDGNEIIAQLKAEGLYETSSIETGCSLYALVNYYSYKKYNCAHFALENASAVRKGIWPRDMAMEIENEFKKAIMDIATKQEINESDKKYLKIVSYKINPDSESKADYMYNLILSLREVAKELEIDIKGLDK